MNQSSISGAAAAAVTQNALAIQVAFSGDSLSQPLQHSISPPRPPSLAYFPPATPAEPLHEQLGITLVGEEGPTYSPFTTPSVSPCASPSNSGILVSAEELVAASAVAAAVPPVIVPSSPHAEKDHSMTQYATSEEQKEQPVMPAPQLHAFPPAPAPGLMLSRQALISMQTGDRSSMQHLSSPPVPASGALITPNPALRVGLPSSQRQAQALALSMHARSIQPAVPAIPAIQLPNSEQPLRTPVLSQATPSALPQSTPSTSNAASLPGRISLTPASVSPLSAYSSAFTSSPPQLPPRPLWLQERVQAESGEPVSRLLGSGPLSMTSAPANTSAAFQAPATAPKLQLRPHLDLVSQDAAYFGKPDQEMTTFMRVAAAHTPAGMASPHSPFLLPSPIADYDTQLHANSLSASLRAHSPYSVSTTSASSSCMTESVMSGDESSYMESSSTQPDGSHTAHRKGSNASAASVAEDEQPGDALPRALLLALMNDAADGKAAAAGLQPWKSHEAAEPQKVVEGEVTMSDADEFELL
jgi:hypothetical protein